MDPGLVIRAQHGDADAFGSLAVACGDRLHAIAHRILRDVDLAEDATQQALLAIWRNLLSLRDPPGTVGHGGEHVGYTSLAGCLSADGVVVVVLANRSPDAIDVSAIAAPLVEAVRSRLTGG